MWKSWFAHTIKCAFMTTPSPNWKKPICTTEFFSEYYARHDWSLLMTCQSKYTRMTSQKNCTLCFFQSDVQFTRCLHHSPGGGGDLLIFFTELRKQRPPRHLLLTTSKHSSTNCNKSSSTFVFIVWSKEKNAMCSFSHRPEKMASKWGKNINGTSTSPHFDVICCLSVNSRRTR